MTRRAFISLLTAIGVLPKQAPAVPAAPPIQPVNTPEAYCDHCWCAETHDGLWMMGGSTLEIRCRWTGVSTTFDDYRMADIPKLCDVVRAMRTKA